MAKCEVTKEKVPTTFLEKVLGTYIKDEKGKKHLVSSAVQKQYNNDKQKILEAIKNK